MLRNYRIYFVSVQETESVLLLRKHFPSGSVFKGEGFYERGNMEKLTVFEIHFAGDSFVIAALAEELRALNGQETVRIVSCPVEVWDIKSPI